MDICRIAEWMKSHSSALCLLAAALMGVICVLFEWIPFFEQRLNYSFFATMVIFFLLGACWIRIPRLAAFHLWYPTVLGLLAFPFFCFVIGSTGFLFGISVSKWEGAAALMLSILLMAQTAETRRGFGVSFLIFVSVWISALFFACIGWEHREDGMMYHKPGSILIAKGWNPVWEPELSEYMIQNGENPNEFRYSHVAYFPKGIWVVNAILHLMTGSTNAGAAVYPAMCAACCILFSFMLFEWFPVGRWAALGVGTILALNPNILIEEIYSGMIDGPLNLCLLMFLFSGILWLKSGEKKWLPFLIGSAVFGCSLKHNAPVFFACIGLIYTFVYVWARWNKLSKVPKVPFREWVLAMLSVPTLVAVLCFNPFITNTVCHSSPFYPLHTFDPEKNPKEDILGIYYWRTDFKSADVLQRFLYTHIFERWHFVMPLDSTVPTYTPKGVHFLSFVPSLTNNGIFSLLLIFSLPLLFFVRRWDFWLVLLAILISVFIHPHSWWGRFVPQLWAFPYLLLCFVNMEVQKSAAQSGRRESESSESSDAHPLSNPLSQAFQPTQRCSTAWRSRWNALFCVLIGWSLWTNASQFSFSEFYQLNFIFAQDSLLKQTEESKDFLAMGGISGENPETGKARLTLHPWYKYYMRELFRSLGKSNFYVSSVVSDQPENLKVQSITRVFVVTPLSDEELQKKAAEKSEASGNSEREKQTDVLPARAYYFPKAFLRTARICVHQLKTAWFGDVFALHCAADEDFKPEWVLNYEALEPEADRKEKERQTQLIKIPSRDKTPTEARQNQQNQQNQQNPKNRQNEVSRQNEVKE